MPAKAGIPCPTTRDPSLRWGDAKGMGSEVPHAPSRPRQTPPQQRKKLETRSVDWRARKVSKWRKLSPLRSGNTAPKIGKHNLRRAQAFQKNPRNAPAQNRHDLPLAARIWGVGHISLCVGQGKVASSTYMLPSRLTGFPEMARACSVFPAQSRHHYRRTSSRKLQLHRRP